MNMKRESTKFFEKMLCKSGAVERFDCSSNKQCESIRTKAYRAAMLNPSSDNKFRANIDYKNCSIVITTIPR